MKKLILTTLTALVVATSVAPVAYATPGAVNKQGCHGKPKHCHSTSDLSTMKNGRRYVQFGNG